LVSDNGAPQLWRQEAKIPLKDEHPTSNIQHRMMNKRTNIEQRMVIEEKNDKAKV
jgi:hypothetical protein